MRTEKTKTPVLIVGAGPTGSPCTMRIIVMLHIFAKTDASSLAMPHMSTRLQVLKE
jgi:hypothetical protein